MSASQPRPPARRGGSWLAPLLAAVLTLALHVTVLVRQRTFPFGPVSRGLGDYGPQYLPFHQALAAALHGSDLVSPRFSWLGGMGVATIPDYATYVASPLNLVLAVVPLDHVELALAWIILGKVALAAAAMTLLLRALTPRASVLPAVLLGVAYACSSWVFDIAIYTPQWLDGLAGFPLLCLVALWCARRAHPFAGVLVVGGCWWANYYTAYMASLGAAVLLVLWLAATADDLRAAARAVARFATIGVLGVASTGPILVPTLLAVRRGTPYDALGLPPLPPRALLARLLPFTEGVAGTPALAAGSLVLVLACALPLATHVPLRQRIVLTVGTGLVVATIPFAPVVIVWNAFDVPNGNPYRFTFVVVALIIICAHLTVHSGGLGDGARTAWPSLPAAVLGLVAVAVAVLAVSARSLHVERLHLTRAAGVWTTGTAVAVVLVALLRGRARRCVGVVLLATTLVEVPLAAGAVDGGLRTAVAAAPLVEHTATRDLFRGAAATEKAGWPVGRVGVGDWPGRQQYLSFNTGLRLGYPGVSYYSSTLPGALSRTLTGLGAGIRAGGRMVVDPPFDPVLDALLAVRVRSADPLLASPRVSPAFPLVREVTSPRPTPTALATPFATRDALLDRPVYTPAQVSTDDGRPLARTLARGAAVSLRVTCPGSTRVQIATHEGDVVARWSGASGQGEVRGPFAGVLSLPALGAGRVDVLNVGTMPVRTVGAACLDEAALRAQVVAARAPRIEVHPGTVDAVFDAPVAGDAVVATVAQEGWSCTVDGRPASITPRSGLLAVDMAGGRTLACGYRTPGVTAGLGVGAIALLTTLTWGFLARRRRRV